MMKTTATVQVNLDFTSESEAVEKIRTGYGVTSIITGLCAASPIVEGRPSGFKSYRSAIWLETDESRCGLLPFVFEPGFTFRDYAEWALDVPMFFVVRDGVYRSVNGMRFRQFLKDGFEGLRATLEDWEIHLSTVFPEVRLKRTIELRGADAGPLPVASGVAALWRGLLDDPEARAAAWALVADRPFADGKPCDGRCRGAACPAGSPVGPCATWPWSSAGSPMPAWPDCRMGRAIARSSSRCARTRRPGAAPPTTSSTTTRRPAAIPPSSSKSGSCGKARGGLLQPPTDPPQIPYSDAGAAQPRLPLLGPARDARSGLVTAREASGELCCARGFSLASRPGAPGRLRAFCGA